MTSASEIIEGVGVPPWSAVNGGSTQAASLPVLSSDNGIKETVWLSPNACLVQHETVMPDEQEQVLVVEIVGFAHAHSLTTGYALLID